MKDEMENQQTRKMKRENPSIEIYPGISRTSRFSSPSRRERICHSPSTIPSVSLTADRRCRFRANCRIRQFHCASMTSERLKVKPHVLPRFPISVPGLPPRRVPVQP
jgi:hypothetical protein